MNTFHFPPELRERPSPLSFNHTRLSALRCLLLVLLFPIASCQLPVFSTLFGSRRQTGRMLLAMPPNVRSGFQIGHQAAVMASRQMGSESPGSWYLADVLPPASWLLITAPTARQLSQPFSNRLWFKQPYLQPFTYPWNTECWCSPLGAPRMNHCSWNRCFQRGHSPQATQICMRVFKICLYLGHSKAWSQCCTGLKNKCVGK